MAAIPTAITLAGLAGGVAGVALLPRPFGFFLLLLSLSLTTAAAIAAWASSWPR